MSDDIRTLKEDAARLIARGRLDEAVKEYVKIVRLDRRDITARQKLAELYARLGKVPEAVSEYQGVAGSYAADGLLLKAIAVCKIILQIDPWHKETQSVLAKLSTERRGDASSVEMPKAMSSALTSGNKRSASEIRGTAANQIKARPKDAWMPIVVPDGTLRGGAAQVPMEASAAPGAPTAPQAPPPSQAHGTPVVRTSVVEARPRPNDPPAELSAAARALLDVFNATPDPTAPATGPGIVFDKGPVPLSAAPSATSGPPAEDIAIDVSFDSGEGAPVVVDQAALASALHGGAPVMSSGGDDGTPMFVAKADSSEGAELSIDDVSIAEESHDDGADLIELSEPARVEIDEVPPIPLFSDLPQDAFIALTERMDLRVATKDEILVQEGEPGTSMFIIIQGKVRVKRKDLEGAQVTESGELTLAELTDGAFFGEMALLSDAPRIASIVCEEDTMLFEIHRDVLADITREYPSVGEVMKRFHKNRLLTNLLKTSPIFQPFSTSEKKDLIEKFKSRSVDEGVLLITRERPGDGLYVLLSGRAEVYDKNAEGKDVLMAELKEGDVFGEMSMLWHKETCASVKASTPCVVLRLPRATFQEIIMTHPQILETLTAISQLRQKRNLELQAPAVASDFIV
jgi:CRP-like cAMP-binding protein